MANKSSADYVLAIQASGKTIYDPISVGDPDLWIPTEDLEALLHKGLNGFDVAGLPNRTRSKIVNQEICKVLGYPVQKTFKRVRPRFPGQQFDIYTQKARNVQVYNEELSSMRRYVLIGISDSGVVYKVKVIDGLTLAKFDNTGTLTKKYQARILGGVSEVCKLVTPTDTKALIPHLVATQAPRLTDPSAEPESGNLLPIAQVFSRISTLVGETFEDPGGDQERNRGAVLHQLVCSSLGYPIYRDNGQFPDVRHQLLEVKLQTSPTIDLGLVLPDSEDPLAVQRLGTLQPQHCDTRYAVFYGETDGQTVTITNLVVTTGEGFFRGFRQFGGKVVNEKQQITLPKDFFDR